MATVEPVTPDTLQARWVGLIQQRIQLAVEIDVLTAALDRATAKAARCVDEIDQVLDDMLAAR